MAKKKEEEEWNQLFHSSIIFIDSARLLASTFFILYSSISQNAYSIPQIIALIIIVIFISSFISKTWFSFHKGVCKFRAGKKKRP